VIHTPGHSPGCVCFYLAKEKTLFSGDTLFRGGMGNVSFPSSSPSQMKRSLQRLMTLPPDTRVYPGHAGPTQIDRETRHTENL
jgi:glyoxylase-like metal-dependent hydrolase (beta-lactamase superfamily II)